MSQKSSLDALKIRSALEVQDVPLGVDVRGQGLLRLQNTPVAVRDVRVNQGASSVVPLDAVSVPGLSWIQLWLVAFVAGSEPVSCPAFGSSRRCRMALGGSHVWRGEAVAPCLRSPTRSRLP